MAESKDDFKKKNKRGKPRPGSYRGGKPSYKDLEITDSSNDAHWYGSDDVLRLAGNLSFFTALGLDVGTRIYPYVGLNVYRGVVPGVMSIDVLDTLPISPSGSQNPSVSPINIAARQQYALIRKANAGAKNYEWTDLIIYEMARSSINQVFAFIARAYGVANTYSMQNRYLPRTLLNMMGFNPDDFISNLASIRLWLNNFAKRANTLALPHSLSYFERKAWIYSSIYTDSQSAKAQIYMFTPGTAETGEMGGFHVYNPNLGLANAGGLERKALFALGSRFSDWSGVADSWLNILLSDDDCAIISGDILKAYGDNNLFKCNQIPEDYTIVPVYNAEVLSQIENLTCTGVEPAGASSETGDTMLAHTGAIIQTGAGGDLISDPAFYAGSDATGKDAFLKLNPVINFHHTDVTPAEVMVGTRLTVKFGRSYVNNAQLYVLASDCGTEIVTDLRVAFNVNSWNSVATKIFTNMSSVSSFVNAIQLTCNFDWAPKVYLYLTDTGLGGYLPFGDLDTYRVMEETELAKLHDTACLNMFGVPLIQNYNN